MDLMMWLTWKGVGVAIVGAIVLMTTAFRVLSDPDARRGVWTILGR